MCIKLEYAGKNGGAERGEDELNVCKKEIPTLKIIIMK